MCLELLTKLTAGYRRVGGQFLVKVPRGAASSKPANRRFKCVVEEAFPIGRLCRKMLISALKPVSRARQGHRQRRMFGLN